MAGGDVMNQPRFTSCLADHLSAYLALRRSVGYELRSQTYCLRDFDRVVNREMRSPGPVSRELIEAYLRTLAHLQPITRRLRLSTIRQFLLYLRQFEPVTYIPDRSLEPARSSPRLPYIFTEDEIRALTQAAYEYPHRYPARRWLLYPTFFALLYVTGMRVSEALSLTLADLDLEQAVLRIRKTKFHKSRLVPLQPSSCAATQQYLTCRASRGHRTTPDAPLFVNDQGKKLPYRTVQTAFQAVRRMARIGTDKQRPRIHDLRHTAAVRRLDLWYREGKDVQSLLPVLVTYLGHSSVSGTAIYLTTTAELLVQASARFEQHFSTDPADRKGDLQ
jgi:site-specific recombinase XerD